MADMDNILELFDCNDNNDDADIPKNENYFIAETLKLIQETNDFPLYIYVMIKTLLTKKELLNNNQIKEITDILGVKPEIKEVIKYKEKIVYKERKNKVYEGDDY
tara:strand:- start:256 stop:570 length:315 start_codon:yes stop_codon:yes gene_type:complete